MSDLLNTVAKAIALRDTIDEFAMARAAIDAMIYFKAEKTYNELSDVEFSLLNDVLRKCATNATPLTLHWSEAENAWWAEAGNKITKTYSFGTIMEILSNHLENEK